MVLFCFILFYVCGFNCILVIMCLVFGVCVFGLLMLIWLYGLGILFNLVWVSFVVLVCEVVMLVLCKCLLGVFFKDGSVLVIVLLLVVVLLFYVFWWLILVVIFFVLVFGKYLYGGFGQNLFNLVMFGYVVVLVLFFLEMICWFLLDSVFGLFDSFCEFFGFVIWLDVWVYVIVFDVLKIDCSLIVDELFVGNLVFGYFGSVGSEWVNLVFFFGGLFLFWCWLFIWYVLLGMFVGLFVMSLLFWNGFGFDFYGLLLFYLFSGVIMFGVFFIVIDLVFGVISNCGWLVFGFGVGVFIYVICVWGGYFDGVVFVVLLMNLVVLIIDYYIWLCIYGYCKVECGFKVGD